MSPEEPLQSPFASSDSPEPTGQPGPVEPDPPRLGILHLLVLTACVAFYMGITRALMLASSGILMRTTFGAFDPAGGTLYGIGGGAALAGLPLFLARRWRRSPFPVHPGECLLVFTGLAVAVLTIGYGAVLFLHHPPGDSREELFALLLIGILTVFFFQALIRVKVPRWRVFFLTIPASYVLAYLLSIAGIDSRDLRLVDPSIGASRGLPFLALMVVLLMDHRQGKRYPWTHWFGVGTRLWLDAFVIGKLLWSVLFHNMPT